MTDNPESWKPARRGPPALPQKRPAADAAWEERRAAPRKEVITEVTLESDTNFYTGFTVDLSTGGLFIVTWDLLPIGTRVNLSFSLPRTREMIAVQGVVRWLRELNRNNPDLWPGMGIQFLEVPERAKASIEAFMKDREPIFYE